MTDLKYVCIFYSYRIARLQVFVLKLAGVFENPDILYPLGIGVDLKGTSSPIRIFNRISIIVVAITILLI